MQKTISIKLAALIAGLGFAMCVALPALAYESLEIEIDIYEDGSIAEVSYEDEDGDDVNEDYEFDETEIEEIYALLAAELDLTADEVEDMTESVTEEDGSVDDADSNEEDEEEEQIDDAEEAIEDAEEAIEKAQAYIDSLDEEEESSLIDYLEGKLNIAEGLLEDAEEAFEDEEYEDAEEYADRAESKAKVVSVSGVTMTRKKIFETSYLTDSRILERALIEKN